MSSPFSFLWAFVQKSNGWHPYQGGADDWWFKFVYAFKPVTSIRPIIHCLALKLELDSCCRVKVIAICNLNLYLDSWQSYISVDPSEFEHVSYHLDKRTCEPKKIIRVDTVDITQSLLGLEDHFPFDKDPRCQISKMAAYNVHCTGRSVNVQPHQKINILHVWYSTLIRTCIYIQLRNLAVWWYESICCKWGVLIPIWSITWHRSINAVARKLTSFIFPSPTPVESTA